MQAQRKIFLSTDLRHPDGFFTGGVISLNHFTFSLL